MRWDEHELETRENLIRYFTRYLGLELNKINPAFHFIRIETPILLPFSIEKGTQRTVQIRLRDQSLVLRQTTALGAYDASRDFLNSKIVPKYHLPLVVWQHGKVFQKRKSNIHEVYNLEYQILFSKTTGVQYYPILIRTCEIMLRKQCGAIFKADEDENDISMFSLDTDTELVRIHERTDFWAGRNIEIVVNMDRCTKVNILHEFGKIRRASAIDKK